jgi:2-(1,2-epoxy-1,2-dihydrophenyl)acetyl-CoA isomerase
MSELLQITREGRAVHLTLNRPEARNALSHPLIDELLQALRDAEADPAVKCIVLRGAGGHFCAGGDVKNFAEVMATPPDGRRDLFERRVLGGGRLPQAVLECSKPVVAVAQGAIAGAGLGLCLAADYVLCARSSFFVAAHVRVGLAVDCLVSSLLVQAMGIKAAMKMALLGERLDAEQALRFGMVSEVVADEDLEAATHALLQRLAAGPAIAMAGTKQLLNEAAYGDLGRQMVLEARAVGRCAASADFATGVAALLAREQPRFA